MPLFTAKMTEELYSTAIGVAVHPLRAVAEDAAEKRARETADWYYARLEEAGWDAEKAFPYPNSMRMGREEYRRVHAAYGMARRLTKMDESKDNRFRRFGDPEFRVRHEEGLAKFVAESRDMAAASYDAFVAKLVNKIGEHTTAVLEGNHVWGESFLTVTFASKPKETWKTQQIWNVSKLGLHFPQWPSRKMKVAR